MKVDLLKNSDASFYKAIEEALASADSAYIGAAYGTYGAFAMLRNLLELFLRRNGKLRTLFDIEKFVTEKRLIEELATIPGDSECKVFINPDVASQRVAGHYHPKFYLFHNRISYRVIIGSSNFTVGGIKKNIECSLSLSGKLDDALFQRFQAFFDDLWTAEYSFNVLEQSQLLDAYGDAFQASSKQDDSKYKKLRELRKKIETEASAIIQTKKDVLNTEFAYLLGLISANSKIDLKKRTLVIDLQRGLANRGTPFEGYYYNPDISDYKISQIDAHRKDVQRMSENLTDLFHHSDSRDVISKKHVDGYHFQIIVTFAKNSPIIEHIRTLRIRRDRTKVVPFIPKEIMQSEDATIVKSFIKGYCDLKSRISASDGIYRKQGGKRIFSSLRMGISIPHSASELLGGFNALLKKIGLTQGVSVTDPSRRSRENLIRIDVRHVPYDLLGTHWRRIFLKDFVYYMNSKKRKYKPGKHPQPAP
jgi:HKD family nuclease